MKLLKKQANEVTVVSKGQDTQELVLSHESPQKPWMRPVDVSSPFNLPIPPLPSMTSLRSLGVNNSPPEPSRRWVAASDPPQHSASNNLLANAHRAGTNHFSPVMKQDSPRTGKEIACLSFPMSQSSGVQCWLPSQDYREGHRPPLHTVEHICQPDHCCLGEGGVEQPEIEAGMEYCPQHAEQSGEPMVPAGDVEQHTREAVAF